MIANFTILGAFVYIAFVASVLVWALWVVVIKPLWPKKPKEKPFVTVKVGNLLASGILERSGFFEKVRHSIQDKIRLADPEWHPEEIRAMKAIDLVERYWWQRLLKPWTVPTVRPTNRTAPKPLGEAKSAMAVRDGRLLELFYAGKLGTDHPRIEALVREQAARDKKRWAQGPKTTRPVTHMGTSMAFSVQPIGAPSKKPTLREAKRAQNFVDFACKRVTAQDAKALRAEFKKTPEWRLLVKKGRKMSVKKTKNRKKTRR